MADETRTVRLDSSERYPFFQEVVGPRSGYAVEVPVEMAERWKRVMVELGAVQDEMEAAYDAARRREAERAELAKAEREAAEAAQRLEEVRYELTHRFDSADTWPAPESDVCAGLDYGTEKVARAERLRIHNKYPSITFDLVHYWCADGHVHLRRRA